MVIAAIKRAIVKELEIPNFSNCCGRKMTITYNNTLPEKVNPSITGNTVTFRININTDTDGLDFVSTWALEATFGTANIAVMPIGIAIM